MKRIAVLILLAVLAAGQWTTAGAQNAAATSERQTEKSEQKQRNVLYKYQKKQEKVQEKAQRTADKQQRRAAKKYEKEQRKLLKNANSPAKQTP
jgi:Ni/Co efflux regulator RcnB